MIPNYLVGFLCITSSNPIEDEFMFHLWRTTTLHTNVNKHLQ